MWAWFVSTFSIICRRSFIVHFTGITVVTIVSRSRALNQIHSLFDIRSASRVRMYVHTAALCVITRRRLHFSASNPFGAFLACSLLFLRVRRESRRFKEHEGTGSPHCNRKSSRRWSHKESQTARIGSRSKTPPWPFVFSFIPIPVGSFAAYLLFKRQTDRELASVKRSVTSSFSEIK